MNFRSILSLLGLVLLLYCPFSSSAQEKDAQLRQVLLEHKTFVSIPNLPADPEKMRENMGWVAGHYRDLGFEVSMLPSETLPILFTEKIFDPKLKTVLFYFHIDGQPVNPEAWDQEDPFVPVLKGQNAEGKWENLDWSALDQGIDEDWRIFARAAADDKAPILMFIEALRQLEAKKQEPKFNIKVVFDPEEEYSSEALLSTLDQYKKRYVSDYFIVMDGPMHPSNKPTLTFGCRGITTCAITTFGGTLPQHSGHYGNYVPNPVFELADILSGMKDAQGRVLIKDYYKGIKIDEKTKALLEAVPYDSLGLNRDLGIYQAEQVGGSYQESIQFPSLNVRQLGTSWKGEGLKTVIPQYARADLDVRLVAEIDGNKQVDLIREHLKSNGYFVIDRDPSDVERQEHPQIVKFEASSNVINAFRTDPNADFGSRIRAQLASRFGEEPIVIRTMGGTVPIVPLINELDVPTLIVPMVNMDNNQHNPNENIRVGNIKQGIQICLSILNTDL